MKVTIEISEETIESLLCSAWEGGSSYWCREFSKINPDKCQYSHQIPLSTGSVTLIDTEENKQHTVKRKSIERGLQAMAAKFPKHFADILADNTDAITGDVLLQCAVFGDTIYG